MAKFKGGEITRDQIQQAIKKKHCPFCKSKEFIGDFPAWQRFNTRNNGFDGTDFDEPNTDADFERIECAKCEKEIPEIIWREWGL